MSRFAVISDIHGNANALEAVLARIESMQVDQIICLGDIVGYGPHPHVCVDLVSRHCDWIVRGNHDEAVINPSAASEFNHAAKEAVLWSRARLGPLHLDALCATRTVVRPHPAVMCVHDSPAPGPTDYVHDRHIAALAFRGVETSICLIGHTHVPMVFQAPAGWAGQPLTPDDVSAHPLRDEIAVKLDPHRRSICNPGSVGQPRDYDPRASFAVLDLNDWTFTVHREAYDIATVQRDTQKAGLPTILADRLAVGA